jgi:hypothetical protein
MPSRSEKSCLARHAPKILGAAAILILPLAALAQITMSGIDGNGDGLSNVVNNTQAYFPSVTPPSAPSPSPSPQGGFLDLGDGTVPSEQLDLVSTSFNGTSSDPNQAMLFDVYSNLSSVSVPTGTKLYLMAFNATYAIPIAYGNNPLNSTGTTSLTQCMTSSTGMNYPCSLGANGYSYGVFLWDGTNPPASALPTALPTFQVGIYPKDICVATGTGAAVTGCDGSKNPYTVPNSTSAGISVTFALVLIPDNSNSYNQAYVGNLSNNLQVTNLFTPSNFTLPTSGTTAPAAIDQQVITTYFQTQASGVNCFAENTTGNGGAVAASYLPAQGQILLNSTLLSLNSPVTTMAPGGSLIVVGNSVTQSGDSTTLPLGTVTYPNVTSKAQLPNVGFNYSAQVVSLTGGNAGDTQLPITNFTDSTANESTYYALEIMVRDVAGWVANQMPAANTVSGSLECELPGGNSEDFVRTSTIYGALSRNSCFIATGAFRGGNPVVTMLRHFRDQVLLPTRLGTDFVQWYYSWSPSAAVWLVDHPAYRIPVLLALVPLQIIAWLCLRPFLIAILALLSALILLAALAYSRGHFGKGNREGAL